MPTFAYEAIDSSGKKIRESSEAPDKETLLLALQSKGLVLTRWLDKDSSKTSTDRQKRTLRPHELIRLTKDLSQLLRAGLELEKALEALERASGSENLKKLAAELRAALREGKSLSDAMASRPRDFSSLYVNMIRVGEVGGLLPDVMERLAGFLEQLENTRKTIISSLTYPAILISVGIVSLGVILLFVVPRFGAIFRDLGQEIPFSTWVLLQCSYFLKESWWLWLGVSLAGCIGAYLFYHSTEGSKRLERVIIRLPVVGRFMTDFQLSRFCRTLGTLILSGVPMLKALSIVQGVVGNHLVRDAVVKIYEEVKVGKKISSIMKNSGVFPELVIQMVAVGEHTGRLGTMLVQVSEQLEAEIEERLKSYLSLLEPITILVMGLVIGGIVISMLLGIFGINEIQF